jgi:GGDEF domain-containing protein
MEFKAQLNQEIQSSQKTNLPFWVILYQIERNEETVIITKQSKATDWISKALNVLKEQSDLIKFVDYYGNDKVVIIPKSPEESTIKRIAENISKQLVQVESNDKPKSSQRNKRNIVYTIVSYSPQVDSDTTADSLMEEAIENLWQNRLS